MISLRNTTSLYKYKSSDKNKIICEDKNIKLVDSIININGENNIIFLGKGIILKNSTINIEGNNNIIYLSESNRDYYLNIAIYNNSVFYSGKNNYFNNILNISISERTSVVLGDGCLFSFGIWLRTSDPHLIYDRKTGKRINLSKNIYIGDHVWVGQNVFLGKGSKIGSGSIIGANAVKSGIVYSNTICVGNPAKQIKENIFWKNDCVHAWSSEKTLKNMYSKKQHIYISNKKNDIFNTLDKGLVGSDVKTKYDFIIKELVNNTKKYRFSICKETSFIRFKRIIKKFLNLFHD